MSEHTDTERLDEYVPYGEEWEKHMMGLTKKQLINLIRNNGRVKIKVNYVKPIEFHKELFDY